MNLQIQGNHLKRKLYNEFCKKAKIELAQAARAISAFWKTLLCKLMPHWSRNRMIIYTKCIWHATSKTIMVGRFELYSTAEVNNGLKCRILNANMKFIYSLPLTPQFQTKRHAQGKRRNSVTARRNTQNSGCKGVRYVCLLPLCNQIENCKLEMRELFLHEMFSFWRGRRDAVLEINFRELKHNTPHFKEMICLS